MEMGSPLASLILPVSSPTLPAPQGSEAMPLLLPQMELELACQWRRTLGPLSVREGRRTLGPLSASEASALLLLLASPSPPLGLEPLRTSLAASAS